MAWVIGLSLFPALLSYAATSDLLRMVISNRLNIALAALFFPVALFAGFDAAMIATHIGVGLLTLAVGFAFFAQGWIGGGDAKLAAATALWLGFGTDLTHYLLLASVLGGFLTLALLYARTLHLPIILFRQAWIARLHDRQTGIPYGIALAAAALIIYPESRIFTSIIQG